jgi:hypothetical protein
MNQYLPFWAIMRLAKLKPDRFFRATSRTIKYALVAYAIMHGLAGTLALVGPQSLFSQHFYNPVIAGNWSAFGLAFPTLAGLWVLNRAVGAIITNIKTAVSVVTTLAVLLGIGFMLWFLFIRPAGA